MSEHHTALLSCGKEVWCCDQMATVAKLISISVSGTKNRCMKKLCLCSSDLLAAAAADGYDILHVDELHFSGTLYRLSSLVV